MTEESKQGDKFDATDDSLRTIPAVRQAFLDAAEFFTEEFMEDGLTARQASSVTAHLLLDAAWGIATWGAILDGATPDKATFRGAVESAFERLNPDAMVEVARRIIEDDSTLSGASQGDAPAGERESMTGVEMIAMERHRQQAEEGYTPEHDATHRHGELAGAASAYAMSAAASIQTGKNAVISQAPPFFMFEQEAWKPDTPLHDLVRAGALIAAQIDVLIAELDTPTLSGASQAKPLPGNAPSQGEDA